MNLTIVLQRICRCNKAQRLLFYRFIDKTCYSSTLPRWRSLCHWLPRDHPQPRSFSQRQRVARERAWERGCLDVITVNGTEKNMNQINSCIEMGQKLFALDLKVHDTNNRCQGSAVLFCINAFTLLSKHTGPFLFQKSIVSAG